MTITTISTVIRNIRRTNQKRWNDCNIVHICSAIIIVIVIASLLLYMMIIFHVFRTTPTPTIIRRSRNSHQNFWLSLYHQQQQQQSPRTTHVATVTAFDFTTIVNYRHIIYNRQRHHQYHRTMITKSFLRPQQQPPHLRRFLSTSCYRTSNIRMMPEGPEIRTVVDQLQGCIGQRFMGIHFVSGRYHIGNNDKNNYETNQKQPPNGYTTFQSSLSFVPSSSSSSLSLPTRTSTTTTSTSLQPLVQNIPSSTTTTTINQDDYRLNDEANIHDDKVVDIITDCNCKGKFMYLILDNGRRRPTRSSDNDDINSTINDNDNYQRSIWITFGMTGRFLSESIVRQYQIQERECHIRWYMLLQSPQSPQEMTKIYYSDPRGFGTLKFCMNRLQLYEKLLSLGPDMLQTCTEQEFISIVQKQKPNLNICRFLMDQSKICGIGNYILAEGLYRAQIDPFASVSELMHRYQPPNQKQTVLLSTLYHALHSVIRESYESQREDHNNNQEYEFQCYGQSTCKVYGHTVRKEINGPHGRTIWYIDQQLFMSRQERNDQASKSLSIVTPDTIPIPTTTTNRRSNGSSNVSKDGTNSSNELLLETMSRKRSKIEMDVPVVTNYDIPHQHQQQSAATNVAPLALNISKNTSLTVTMDTVATANTPGNMKLAAILANNNNKKIATTSIRSKRDESKMDATTTVDDESRQFADALLNGISEPGWKDALYETLRMSTSFTNLAHFLNEEEATGKIVYPPRNEIFTALNLCPIDMVKVIIIGQDPYHRYGQCHGLAFSVRKGVRPPPSLQNIFKELIDDIGMEGDMIRHGNLSCWAKRGVLLLNTVLTVREGEAFSHANQGWEEVTNTILRAVCERHTQHGPMQLSSEDAIPQSQGIVFLLWGNAAIQMIGNILQPQLHSNCNVHIIQTSHPSPLGATKTKSPFLGSKCFSRTNKALTEMGHDPIDWSVE